MMSKLSIALRMAYAALLTVVIGGALFIKVFAAEPEPVAANEYTAIAESMTEEELQLLKKIVAAESQTQVIEGRKAVVEVIFNRVLSPEFPDTLKGVLSQKGQFATWPLKDASWVEPNLAAEAIEEVLSFGRTVLPSSGYVYFSRGKSRYGQNYIKIQDHWFGEG